MRSHSKHSRVGDQTWHLHERVTFWIAALERRANWGILRGENLGSVPLRGCGDSSFFGV